MITSYSMRNMFYGQEYYGTFFRALYTLFQVLTGESWSEAVVRPLLMGSDENSTPPWVVALFFVSFIVLTQIVLINVVVAVLLDKFVVAPDDEKKDEGDTADEQPGHAANPTSSTNDGPNLPKAQEAGDGASAPTDVGVSVFVEGASRASMQQQLLSIHEQLAVLGKKMDEIGEIKSKLDALLEGSWSTLPRSPHTA